MSLVARRSYADEVRLMLRERILRGELVPGQRVIEQKVAQELGTSQGPVREAFASLCQEGLLISLPHRGTFVSEVSDDDAHMAYAIRALVEPLAVELAVDKMSDAFYDQLDRHLAAMREAADQQDVASFNAADVEFHTAFYELAGTDVLLSVWRPIASTIRKFVAVAAPQYVNNLRESAEDHVILIELSRNRAADELKAASAAHLNNIWRRIGAARDL